MCGQTHIPSFSFLVAQQEVWDTAKKISCVWTSKYDKAVNFEPLQVGMLDVVQTSFEGDDVKCWMDIQRGTYPNVSMLPRFSSLSPLLPAH